MKKILLTITLCIFVLGMIGCEEEKDPLANATLNNEKESVEYILPQDTQSEENK